MQSMKRILNFILSEMENHQRVLTRELSWSNVYKTNLAAFWRRD